MSSTDNSALSRLVTEVLFTAMENLRDGTITAQEANKISAAAGALLRLMEHDIRRRERKMRVSKAKTLGTRMPRVPNGDVSRITNRDPLKGSAHEEPITDKGDGPCRRR